MEVWKITRTWGNLYIDSVIINADYPCLLICKTAANDYVLCSICDTETCAYLCMILSRRLLCDFLDGKHPFMDIVQQAPRGILYIDDSDTEVLYQSYINLPDSYLPEPNYCFELLPTDSFYTTYMTLAEEYQEDTEDVFNY